MILSGDMSQVQLDLTGCNDTRVVSPFLELGAYEALWLQDKASFKRIASMFAKKPGALPTDFVDHERAEELAYSAQEMIRSSKLKNFGIRVNGAAEYPLKLRDAAHPIELLYYQGWWDLVYSRCVAVVGTRNPSREGVENTRLIVEQLVKDSFTIVSGLAAGIDTIAHTTAISKGGLTIAVIGTPLTKYYPSQNAELQKKIASDYLLISQVPLHVYKEQDYRINRFFFPERNITMSALTEATIIVEAGESSGTHVQARAALAQKRKLFILDSCFRNPKLTWPHKFEKQGAIRVKSYNDIRRELS